MKNREGEMRTEERSTPPIGVLVRHLPTGIVGVVEKVYAAGEHPTATCEVVALSTGDELVLKAEDFEPLSSPVIVDFWKFLLSGLGGVVKVAAVEAERRGVPPSIFQPLFRAALASIFRMLFLETFEKKKKN